MKEWQEEMQRKPSLLNEAAKSFQTTFNEIIPDKVHEFITNAIKQITKGVISGAGFITPIKKRKESLELMETVVKERIKFYRSSAAVEGAVTGYGGFLSGLADLPIWLTLKMKMLFEIAAHYGFDVKDHKERVFILHVFQITFSSQKHRNEIYPIMANWALQKENLPDDLNDMDWRTYWEEYRDNIDLAKLLQLIPGFGAIVGTMVNYQLTQKLGTYAMNAYRMRLKL